MAGYIKNRNLADEVGPGPRGSYTAGANISANRFVKLSGSNIIVAPVNDLDVIGALASSTDIASGDSAIVIYEGDIEVVADVAVAAGDLIKCGALGKAVPALTSTKSGVTIASSTGSSFANQPANDGVEILSSSALDTMPLDVYGTTNGGVVVVKERITLTGTTAAPSVKTDFGVILGYEIPDGYPTAAGTITIREASGDATISTMASGTRRKGITLVTLANSRAFNHIIGFTADSTTTKTIGAVGTDTSGTALMEAVVATGTTEVQFTNAFRTVTKILTGDLETARTGTYKTDLSVDGNAFILGYAKEAAVAGATFTMRKYPQQRGVRNLYTLMTASAPISGTGSETTFNRKITIPANSLYVGRRLRISGEVFMSATTSTDTLLGKVKLGSTALISAQGGDATNSDTFVFSFEVVPRAVAGATAACVGTGIYTIGIDGTATMKAATLASTNFATNGALAVTVTGTWSTSSASDSCRLDVFNIDLID